MPFTIFAFITPSACVVFVVIFTRTIVAFTYIVIFVYREAKGISRVCSTFLCRRRRHVPLARRYFALLPHLYTLTFLHWRTARISGENTSVVWLKLYKRVQLFFPLYLP